MIEKYSRLKRNLLTLLVIVIISICSFGYSNAQSTVYIDPSYTGSTQNGTQQYPYKSWNSVVWTNGTTYLQKAGTTFNTSGSLIISSKNNITIGAYGTGSRPKIVSSGANTTKVIDITSCYNMVITGVEVSSTTGMVTAAILIDGTGSGNNLIDNCSLHDTQWGIRILTTSSGNRILNCEVFNTKDDGIYIKDTPDIEIGYCNIYNVNLNYFINPDQSFSAGDNIQIASTNSHVFNVHNNTLDHSSTGNKFCFIAWGNNYSGTLENNVMIGNSSQVTSCVYLSPTTGTVTARYNEFNNGNYGIYSYVANFNVYYNKFSANKTAIAVLNNYHLLAENNVFYNNINVAISGLSGSTVISKNNIFHITSGAKAYSTNGSLTSNYNTFNTQHSGFINGHGSLASWSSASGQDLQSMVANPQFVNPAAGNFTLQPTSPCINAGVVCGYTQDFFGNAVPFGSSSDIGYFEYATATNNPPVIQNQSFSVPENSPASTVVGQVVATDPDQGQTLSYSITGGNTNNTFNINASTGVITVNNSLNFESVAQYSLQVTVTDNQNASDVATITISVQDVNEPPAAGDQGFNITPEASNGTLVGQVTASDPDNNQVLSYDITSGNAASIFSIDSQSGNIYVADNTGLTGGSTIVLGVTVTDNGTPVLTDQCQVTIIVEESVNQSPVITDQQFSVNENAAIGSLVGMVEATDPNAGQALTFTIVAGNYSNAFSLSASGLLTVANPSALNYEQINLINLTVSVTDNGSPALSAQANVAVTITDLNESPLVIAGQHFTVSFTSPVGTFIGHVDATDPDNNQVLSYSIIDGNQNGAFQIGSSNGDITVANTSALKQLVNKTVKIRVQVTDNGTPQLSHDELVSIRVTRKKANFENGNNNTTKISNVYPNPSPGGQFNIEITNSDETNLLITIFNLDGDKVYSTTEQNNGTLGLNLEHLSKGVYIMNIVGERLNETKKLIIQ